MDLIPLPVRHQSECEMTGMDDYFSTNSFIAALQRTRNFSAPIRYWSKQRKIIQQGEILPIVDLHCWRDEEKINIDRRDERWEIDQLKRRTQLGFHWSRSKEIQIKTKTKINSSFICRDFFLCCWSSASINSFEICSTNVWSLISHTHTRFSMGARSNSSSSSVHSR